MNNETKFFLVDSDKMRNHGFIYSLRNEVFFFLRKKHLNTHLILVNINISSTSLVKQQITLPSAEHNRPRNKIIHGYGKEKLASITTIKNHIG